MSTPTPDGWPDVLIGVHVTAAAQGLAATLAALHANTPQPFRLIILADPDPGEAAALETVLAATGSTRICAVPAPGGAAASFNQLVSRPADTYVFLECGTHPGPVWLEPLLAAVRDDPATRLAGPSTNLCWNEQCAAPDCSGDAGEIGNRAETLRSLHPGARQSMAPLHSLSDFCLAVRHDVVAAIGGADQSYGRGPCWEMDYSARAARAGFAGVWAKDSFVHRSPFPVWRAAAEPQALELARRLYQDRFCGRRAGYPGGEMPYSNHCQGDDCTDFAPFASTRLHLPLPPAAETTRDSSGSEWPLISCIMPTRGRPRFVAQAIAYFHRQDYPRRELIIVHHDDADLPEDVRHPGIRVVRTTHESIGGMRNAAVEASRGGIIVHWDDDDWHGSQRLTRQAMPILQGDADLTGLNDTLFMVIPSGEFWSVTPELYADLFVENIHGGTLMYRRDVWNRAKPYPDISLREDVDFMLRAMGNGARLGRVGGRDIFAYVRHGRNSWEFDAGSYPHKAGWQRVPKPSCLGEDSDFYFPPVGPSRPVPAVPRGLPLVSCIMPTRNRRDFVPTAIGHFLRQDYPSRELIILDDGESGVADLIPDLPSVRYVRLDDLASTGPASIGAKRNMACKLARGEIVVHWDDDDWMAAGWLSSQVETLRSHDADLCGLDKVHFFMPSTGKAWRYVYDGKAPWICGGTLCYKKELWRRMPFQDISVGEDNAFVWSSQAKRIAVNARHDLYLSIIHDRNTSPKVTTDRRWRPVKPQLVEQMLRESGFDMPAAAE
jgi:glycosyltransferase involved in cell wall biosynthesis